ncbi:MAG: hypothetical protein ABSH35_22725 [Isosphaeraceae bacterium]
MTLHLIFVFGAVLSESVLSPDVWVLDHHLATAKKALIQVVDKARKLMDRNDFRVLWIDIPANAVDQVIDVPRFLMNMSNCWRLFDQGLLDVVLSDYVRLIDERAKHRPCENSKNQAAAVHSLPLYVVG